MNTTQTPTPWHIGMNPGPFIYGPQGEQIADLTGALSFSAGPNAQFIVRACNSHAQLVAALEEAKANLLSYMVYAEEMKKIGRGHEPLTGKRGMSPQYLINHINAALTAAQS